MTASIPLDEPTRARILNDAERLSRDGLYVVAVAYRPSDLAATAADGGAEPLRESHEPSFVYAGMVGIADPPRSEAAAAIADAHRAGVRVLMITGDHPRVAARIARQLRIGDGRSAMSGAELDRLDERQLHEVVRRCSQYARVDPVDKLRIIDALRADHQVVAVTGEGINDAPALKLADIGIAMGRSGTEVAKEAAKMILADDNFATIVGAIREGRGIFSNIKKFLRYLLSSNMGDLDRLLRRGAGRADRSVGGPYRSVATASHPNPLDQPAYRRCTGARDGRRPRDRRRHEPTAPLHI